MVAKRAKESAPNKEYQLAQAVCFSRFFTFLFLFQNLFKTNLNGIVLGGNAEQARGFRTDDEATLGRTVFIDVCSARGRP